MTKINFQKKVWNSTNIISNSDLNKYETTFSTLDTEIQNLKNEYLNTITNNNLYDINRLEKAKKSLSSKLNDLESRVSRTQNNIIIHNFHKVFTETNSYLYLENNIKMDISHKNKNREIIAYAYYKRTSTLLEPIVINFDTDISIHSLTKDFSFVVANLDTNNTSNMLASDIKEFCTLTNISGVGAYSYTMQITSNSLLLVITLLGGFPLPVRKRGTLTLSPKNDTYFIPYK